MSVFILGFALVRYMSAPTSDPRQTNEIKSKPAAAICGTEAGADDRSRGTDCYENNNYALAIEYLSRHVEKDPNDSKSLGML